MRFIAISALLCVLSQSFASCAAGSIDEVRSGLSKSHERLLKIPGGISLEYRVSVLQDPAKPVFTYRNGLKGFLRIKWPKLLSHVEGEMWGYSVFKDGAYHQMSMPTVREADYNFETQISVARDDKHLGQIANFRHAFSAIYCYPLVMQYFEETDQFFVPGVEPKSSVWLPAAIQEHSYSVIGKESTSEGECIVLEQPGVDKLWLAPRLGYLLVKRELTYGRDKPLRETVSNTAAREVAAGIYVPMRQTQELFDPSGKRLLQLRIDLESIAVGKVADADVRVDFPQDIAVIEDSINGITIDRTISSGDAMETAIKRGDYRVKQRFVATSRLGLLVNVIVMLGLAIWWARRKLRA